MTARTSISNLNVKKLWKLILATVIVLPLLLIVLPRTLASADAGSLPISTYEGNLTPTGGTAFGDWYTVAQTFKATSAHSITAVMLNFFRFDGSAGAISVGIYNTNNGWPVGSALVSGAIDLSLITTSGSGAWYTIQMNSSYPLRAGLTYAIIVYTPSRAVWRTSENYAYADGGMFNLYYGWHQNPAYSDYVFRILGEPTAAVNEFVLNHAGGDTNQFVEIAGYPSTSYADYTLLDIDGDADGDIGKIDQVFPIGTTDASGIWSTGFLDRQLDTGTSSFLLVKGFTGAVGQDLDANNDGGLDAKPWTDLIDAVTVTDNDIGDYNFWAQPLPIDMLGGASRFPNGSLTWYPNDFDGAGLPGFEGAPVYGEAYNTPGTLNSLVPLVSNYPLTVISNPAGFANPAGSGTYASGSSVSITAPANIDIVAGQSRYHFTGWSGAGVTFANASAASTQMTMPAGAATVTANYTVQYYLTVNNGGHGAAEGSNWYPAGSLAQVSVSSLTADVSDDTQYLFNGWTGAASGAAALSDAILMNGPKTAAATWIAQYKVTFSQTGLDLTQ